jgi:hypothetical protein
LRKTKTGLSVEYHVELQRLKIRTRNRLRAVVSRPLKDAISQLNAIRKDATASEMVQVERTLWAHPKSGDLIVPRLFPTEPQTEENFLRLDSISLKEQIQVIELHARANKKTLHGCIGEMGNLSCFIVNKDFEKAALKIYELWKKFGYSHFLLRKSALLRALIPLDHSQTELEEFLKTCGLGKNNIVVRSLLQCFQQEQDFLSMKRSILSLPNRGLANRFTRDMCRVPFHPHCSDEKDLADQLQSALQSSLFDAIVIAKVNAKIITSAFEAPTLKSLWELFDSVMPNMDQIACLYSDSDSDCEHHFYKQSSAWLEVDAISRYRRFLDHFYDAPDAGYFKITQKLINEVSEWVGLVDLDDLPRREKLTNHGYEKLGTLEINGSATRSALFNLCLYRTNGFTPIKESNLIDLMGMTRDLSKTMPVDDAANLAKLSESSFSKLILYLLIAKRSRNEKYDYLLRRVLQEIVSTKFDRDLVNLLDHVNSRSQDIARYAYEIFTEDFIAKLFDFVESTPQVTKTRAAIHQWMGAITGERIYLDRARTLLIDDQINRIRGELDDNRIYVDIARFHDWFDDEMLREMNVAMRAIELDAAGETDAVDSVLLVLIERCYESFCSNRVFGIASYLGRRIRHGTFKGHLYADIVKIETNDKFRVLLSSESVSRVWLSWKSKYEHVIDGVIRERLHVASTSKRDGFLNPSLAHPQKQEISRACARAIRQEISNSKSSESVKHLVGEFCWRLAEVDLSLFGGFLKSQNFVNKPMLASLRSAASSENSQAAGDLTRELTRQLDEKLRTMRTWFKKPLNVAPKASLPLLYLAVAAEVRKTHQDLTIDSPKHSDNEIELAGGAYHLLYDAMYVVVSNAASHGKPGGLITNEFRIDTDEHRKNKSIAISITSELKSNQTEIDVLKLLKNPPQDDVENAQMFENRSGIPKLHHLQKVDPKFSLDEPICESRKVRFTFRYQLEY